MEEKENELAKKTQNQIKRNSKIKKYYYTEQV